MSTYIRTRHQNPRPTTYHPRPLWGATHGAPAIPPVAPGATDPGPSGASTTYDPRPTTLGGACLRVSLRESPITGHRSPITGFRHYRRRPPAPRPTACRLSVAGHRSLITGHRFPALPAETAGSKAHGLQTFGCRSPVTDHRSPITGFRHYRRRPPAPGRTLHHPPSTINHQPSPPASPYRRRRRASSPATASIASEAGSGMTCRTTSLPPVRDGAAASPK